MRWKFKRLFIRAKENFGKAFSELFSDIRSASYELFVQIPRDIKEFIKTLWAYKGILWRDRNWDHAFILILLQFKIKRTKEYIGKNKRHTRYKLDVNNMQKAENMIEAILNDDHDKVLREAHDNKWGPATRYSVPVPGSSSSYLRIARPNVHSPEDAKKQRREYSRMLYKMIKSKQKAWSKFWAHLDKHMEEWWD